MTCNLCGSPTPRRLCRPCERADKHDGTVGGEARDDDQEVETDGGQLTVDDTLRLTDEGLEMPDWLRGYQGSFTIRTGEVDGNMETTDTGLPDQEFWDGIIAVMPEAGEYNPEIPDGHMVITAPGEDEWCYEIVDERGDAEGWEVTDDA